MKEICIIAAAAENNALGKNNQLLWHLPDDFKFFKDSTTGHPLVMGRKTFESLPQALPNRTHYIISRNDQYRVSHPDCIVVKSLKEAFNQLKGVNKIFVAGGGEIYKQALPLANKIALTRVHHSFEADTFFPELNESDWKLVESDYHPKDTKHAFDFTFEIYERR